jgi:DNA-binding LacI/PurR family transcriptional regulator
MKKHQVTIVDIARELKISKSTVSRALCNQPGISPEMKAAVLEVANRLDYQPNLLAQGLIHNQTHTIGVVIPDIERPFFAAIVSGVYKVAASAGYRVMVCQSNEGYGMEVSNVQALVASRVDGLLLCHSKDTRNYDHVILLHKKGIPVVLFDRVGNLPEFSSVIIDNEAAGFSVTEHLLQLGRRRIAILAGPPQLPMSDLRIKGYANALSHYGLAVSSQYIYHGDFKSSSAVSFAQMMLSLPEPPDGIVCIYDGGAIDVMQMLKKAGIRIPADIAITGMGNEQVSSVSDPALTTLNMHSSDMGRVAAELLFAEIQRNSIDPERRLVQTELIIRGSSELGIE